MKLLLLLFALFFIIHYVNKNKDYDTLMNVKINIFNYISFFFIGLLLFYTFLYGFNKGVYNTLFIWSFFVVATPVPEAGLLVSIPFKKLFNIDLQISQVVLSLFCLFFITYSYYYYKYCLKKIKLGRFIIKVFELCAFSLFIVSILSSVIVSYLFNEFLNSLLYEKKIVTYTNKVLFIFFIFLFSYYFYLLTWLHNCPISSI